MIRVQCPECDAELKVPDEITGRSGRCPKCHQPVPIAKDQQEEASGPDEPGPIEVAPAEPKAVPSDGGKRRRSRTSWDSLVSEATQHREEREARKNEEIDRRSTSWAEDLKRRLESLPAWQAASRRASDLVENVKDRLEPLPAWKVATIGVGAVTGVVLTLVLILTVLSPLVGLGLDALFSAPPADRLPDRGWMTLGFGQRGKVSIPGAVMRESLKAGPVVLNVLKYVPDEDDVFAVASNSRNISQMRSKRSPATLLNDFCDGLRDDVRANSGVELSRRPMVVGEFPAVQMISRLPVARGKVVHRAILVDNELYVLIAGGKGYTPEHPDIRRFLDSFVIKGSSLEAKALPVPKVDPFPPETRKAAKESLKKIGTALARFVAEHECFPAQAIYDDQDKPLLSWRVALLPSLGETALYEQFHLDEPWNSRHNKELIAKIPAIYAPKARLPLRPGETAFRALVSPWAVFDPAGGHAVGDVTDGLGRTLLIVEAAATVPWTKPEDLEVGDQVPALGSHYSAGFVALAADGQVYEYPKKIDPAKFHALVSRAGGEKVEIGDLSH